MTALLEISDLNVTFPGRDGEIWASQHVSFSIEKGKISVLVGETGSGKSVIGYSILHLLPGGAKVSGSIRYNGIEILSLPEDKFDRLRGREISVIPQNPSGSLDPLMRCGKQIAESLEVRGVPKDEQNPAVITLLQRLNFPDSDRVAASLPHELSGGMRQRITTGIALASKPRLLVLDEPTKGLDYASKKASIELFMYLKKNQQDTQLVITHDLDLAEMIGDAINVLYCGELIESGSVVEIFEDPLHPYTQGLIAALPRKGMTAMPGISPGLSDLPQGCYFHDRCPHPCSSGGSKHPAMQEITSTRSVRCHQFSE